MSTVTAEPGGIDEAALAALDAAFTGPLIRPRDADYESARRTWNWAIDRFPALVARCTGVADVVEAMRFVRRTGLPVAVRGGGHSLPGHSTCDGGVVIDLSLMNGIRVDPDARTARAQAGVLLGALDRETQAFGLAVPSGIVSHTGLAGLTLGGGIGHLMRKYGLTIDQLLSVDVVTADGEFVTASAEAEPELFWGMRGAGANFGIVTSFEFRLNSVGPIVLAGPVAWPIADADAVLAHYRDWITGVPDDLTTIVVHRRIPSSPIIPQELWGQPAVIVVCCYAGNVDDGEGVVAPMRNFGRPLLDLCAPKPFVVHQSMFDASLPAGWWYHYRSCDVVEISDDVIDLAAEHASAITSPHSTFSFFQLGGAVARVGEDETAFGGRTAGHNVLIGGITETEVGFDRERAWVRRFWDALAPHGAGAYVNFLMDEGHSRVQRAHGPGQWARLVALKRRYDPDNVFRLNQNIPPS